MIIRDNISSKVLFKGVYILVFFLMLLGVFYLLVACNEISTSFNKQQTNLISLGEVNSAVIMPDGSLWAWGGNAFGQLGDGTTYDRNVPVQIGLDTDWASVSVGAGFTVATKSDGSLWYWGASWDDVMNGNLGSSTYRITKPTQIGTNTDWSNVVVGYSHILALKTDGSLWAWGRNRFGQLGDGTTIERSVPVQVGSDTDWASIVASNIHTMAIKQDGSLWAWGYNAGGMFGDGTSSDRYSPLQTTPIKIGTDTDWMMIATGGSHTAALKRDGSLWTWGTNQVGQLGDGTTINRYNPAQIGTYIGWKYVSVGSGTTLAIKEDGSLWAWGNNTRGYLGIEVGLFDSQLSTSEFDHVLEPVQVGTNTDWVHVAAYFHIVGVREDSSVWSWGFANMMFGVIGDGSRESRSVPTKIIDGKVRFYTYD